MERDSVTDCIIGLAIDVHKALGPGLLESAYEECLCHEVAIHHVPFGAKCRYRWNTKESASHVPTGWTLWN